MTPADDEAATNGAPTHDYIAQLAGELAEMARELGDRRLGHLLDLAATFAELPPERVQDRR